MNIKKLLSNLSVLLILSVAGFLLIANFLHIIYLNKTFEVNLDNMIPKRVEMIERIDNKVNIITTEELGFEDDEIIVSSVEEAYDWFFNNPLISMEGELNLNFRDLVELDDMILPIYTIPRIYEALSKNGIETDIYFENYALNRIARQNIVFVDGRSTLNTHTYKMPSRTGQEDNFAAESRIYMYYACLSEFDLALEMIIREAGLDA